MKTVEELEKRQASVKLRNPVHMQQEGIGNEFIYYEESDMIIEEEQMEKGIGTNPTESGSSSGQEQGFRKQ